ncbi:EamA family transporter [Streptomyces sp. NBC_00872]|uniref:EamA family transporter n=1 Tax=Streptomyces sp. NBC_00872 TaxID=2903686 RepID=UPI003870E8E6|nr:EamA family transporter [Streptomyces sp. NBC_00872]
MGVGVGTAGVVPLFWKDLGGASAQVSGAPLVTAAACYAAGAIRIQQALADVHPITVAASALCVSCILLLPTLALVPARFPSPATALRLIVLGTVATGGSLAPVHALIGRVGSVRASLPAYPAPAFARLYDIPLGRLPTATALAGLALILNLNLTGSAAAARSPRRQEGEPLPRAAL